MGACRALCLSGHPPRDHLLCHVGSSSLPGKTARPIIHRLSAIHCDRPVQDRFKYSLWCIYSMGDIRIPRPVWNHQSPVWAHCHAGCPPLHVMHSYTGSARFVYVLVLFHASNMSGCSIIRRMLDMADRKLCILSAVHCRHGLLHPIIRGSISMHDICLYRACVLIHKAYSTREIASTHG